MRSTIINKKKICISCGNLDYHFSKKMCKQCATVKSTSKRIEKYEEEQHDESLKHLVEDLDSIFSQYIRCKYANKDGIVACYTSGKLMRWQDSQCGHFISRKNYATRWLPQNCRPQSEYDNCFLSGNIDVYRQKLEEEEPGIVEYLQEEARQVSKPTRDELKSLIIEYRHKLNLVKKKFEK